MSEMNSLESIRNSLEDYLHQASRYGERRKMFLIRSNASFRQKIFDAFFSFTADPTLTPEDIALKLETFTSGLDCFSTNRPIQSLIAHACLEALVSRKPKMSPSAMGTWEKLLWIIVKLSSFTSKQTKNVSLSVQKTSKETVSWITKIVTKKLCPNPCLRLELFRFIRRFKCDHVQINQKAFRNKLIITLLEISDNYTSLTLNQLPNFCPMDLQVLMWDNDASITYLMSDLNIKESKIIIVALLKLTRLLALLEKEKRSHDPTSLYIDLSTQMDACSTFCGLIPAMAFIPVEEIHKQECVLYFIKNVSNDPLLINYLVDALNTISDISKCFPEVYYDDDGLDTKYIIFHRFIRNYIRQLPRNKLYQEIYGGCTPANESLLKCMQYNIDHDYNDFYDSDNDSSSDEDDLFKSYRAFASQEIQSFLMSNQRNSDSDSVSDESDYTSSDSEDISGEEVISDE